MARLGLIEQTQIDTHVKYLIMNALQMKEVEHVVGDGNAPIIEKGIMQSGPWECIVEIYYNIFRDPNFCIYVLPIKLVAATLENSHSVFLDVKDKLLAYNEYLDITPFEFKCQHQSGGTVLQIPFAYNKAHAITKSTEIQTLNRILGYKLEQQPCHE